MSYTSPIQHTHIPGGLGSRTSPIIMHIPGGVVPIYPGIWAPAQLHPTPTHPGVWCPSTRGSEVLHIPHPTPTYLGVWGPAPPPSSRAYPWVWSPPHPTSNTHIPRGLGSCTSPIQYPHTGASGVLLTSIQHPHTRGSDAHLPGDPGSRSPHLGTHIPAALVPTHPGLWGPARLPPAPTDPPDAAPTYTGTPIPSPYGTYWATAASRGPTAKLPKSPGAQLSALSTVRHDKTPPASEQTGGKRRKQTRSPPPKKGGRGAPRHRGGGSGPLPPTSIRPIVLLWGSPESSAGLG